MGDRSWRPQRARGSKAPRDDATPETPAMEKGNGGGGAPTRTSRKSGLLGDYWRAGTEEGVPAKFTAVVSAAAEPLP